jgi:hypothetical protein
MHYARRVRDTNTQRAVDAKSPVASVCNHDDKAAGAKQPWPFNKPYDDAETALAGKIARATGHQSTTMREVGCIVAAWMTHIGAKPRWGTFLVARIAKHPKLDVSRQYIYQCWHVHELVEQHGAALAKFKLRDSALVQLARITQARHLTAEKQRQLLLACAAKAAKEKLPVDAVRREVSVALRAGKHGETPTTDEVCVQFKCRMEVAAAEVEQIKSLVSAATSQAQLSDLVSGVECILSTAIYTFERLSGRAAAVAPALAARVATRFEGAAEKLAKLASGVREALTADDGTRSARRPATSPANDHRSFIG